jgi:hypothetical protein
MIEAPRELTGRLSVDLLSTALAAMNDAERHHPLIGHA